MISSPHEQQLNLPPYPFRLKQETGKTYIFDELRKKFLLCTPEEWVRQHLVQYLIRHKNYPKSLISLESGLEVYERKRRSDLLVYRRDGHPFMLIECKAPGVKIGPAVFDQIVAYNTTYRVPFLLVSNGLDHYCCAIDYETKSWIFVEDIPEY